MTLSDSEKFGVLAFQPFDFNRTWWRLFHKCTKIYVFVFFIVCPSSIYGIPLYYRYLRFHTSSSILLGQADVHEISFKNVNIYFNCSQWQAFKGYLTLATLSLFDLLVTVFYVCFRFTAFNYPFGFSKRFLLFFRYFSPKTTKLTNLPVLDTTNAYVSFGRDMWYVGGFLPVVRYPPPMKLIATILLKYGWKWR